MFDYLVLLKDGGVGFFGPVTQIRDYFSEMGNAIPENENVADFIVDLTYTKEDNEDEFASKPIHQESETTLLQLLTDDEDELIKNNGYHQRFRMPKAVKRQSTHTLTSTPEGMAGPNLLITQYSKSRLSKLMSEMTKNIARNSGRDKLSPTLARYPTGFLKQVNTLIQRSIRNMIRARSELAGSFGLSCGNLLFFGLLYSGLKTTTGFKQTDLAFVQSLKAFIFQIINGICLLELDVLARGIASLIEQLSKKRLYSSEKMQQVYTLLLHIIQHGFFGSQCLD